MLAWTIIVLNSLNLFGKKKKGVAWVGEVFYCLKNLANAMQKLTSYYVQRSNLRLARQVFY